MTNRSRLIRACVGSAFIAFATAGLAQAQDATELPPNTQLPRQTIPTGDEDAPRPASAARSAAAGDALQLERELIRMTSESDKGLVAVKQPDNSVRVELDDRFMSVLVATPTSDGGNEISCHTGHEALEKVKHAQAIAAGEISKRAKSSAASPAPRTVAREEK